MTAVDLDLKEALEIIEENGLERDVFMWLFRNSTALKERMTADDCAEVFEGILKGKDDLTKERLEALCAEYDADLNEIVNGAVEGEQVKQAVVEVKERKQRFTGKIFRFRKVFGQSYRDVKYFILRGEKDFGEWVEIDANLYVDLKAMVDEVNVRTTFNDGDIWELEIRTDARRERMFTTIAKYGYNVEV